MMNFELIGDPIAPADIELMVGKCMAWTHEKHAIAKSIGGRMLVRRTNGPLAFCCVKCFHPEQVFEFRVALPAEEIPKGQGWMIIEDRVDGISNRSVDA